LRQDTYIHTLAERLERGRERERGTVQGAVCDVNNESEATEILY